jgi:hypothetical protein
LDIRGKTKKQWNQWGFDGHIPSNDPAYDFIVIHAELQLASKCTKFVHGSSSFADVVYDAMLGAGNNVTRFVLDTSVSKEEAQANYNGDIKLVATSCLTKYKMHIGKILIRQASESSKRLLEVKASAQSGSKPTANVILYCKVGQRKGF